MDKIGKYMVMGGAGILGTMFLIKNDVTPYFFGKNNQSTREKAASSLTKSPAISSQEWVPFAESDTSTWPRMEPNPQTYFEGFHLKLPAIQTVYIFDTRTRTISERAQTCNRDLQRIDFEIKCLFKPNSEQLALIYDELGPSYDRKVLSPILKECAKTVIAQFNAQQLLSQVRGFNQL